jgi:hypothetical protein
MVGPCPPVSVDKCPVCRTGRPCPIHNNEKMPNYKELAKYKRRKFSGKRKGKSRPKKGTKPRI